ncbi:hypothetical protein HDV05_006778 [Chytridiales sp. JEL 0842]|nr:hypothetical protein HDV05_006778 [Chytridiales sp. JEL 0842]
MELVGEYPSSTSESDSDRDAASPTCPDPTLPEGEEDHDDEVNEQQEADDIKKKQETADSRPAKKLKVGLDNNSPTVKSEPIKPPIRPLATKHRETPCSKSTEPQIPQDHNKHTKSSDLKEESQDPQSEIDEELALSEEQLQRFASDTAIRSQLKSQPELIKLLKTINESKKPEDLINEALSNMHQFQEFATKTIEVIQNERKT